MKVAMEAVRERPTRICEAAICYTGDILDPKRTKYSLEILRQDGQGTGEDGHAYAGHQGHGRPVQAVCRRALVKALRDEVACRSISTRTTPAASTPAAYLRAADAGVDIVDARDCRP